jgi:hypothetical protein
VLCDHYAIAKNEEQSLANRSASLRKHSKIAADCCKLDSESLLNDFTIAAEAFRKCCTVARQLLQFLLINRFRIATQSLRNCCEIAERSLLDRCVITKQLLHKSYRIDVQSPRNAARSLRIPSKS